MVLGRRHLEYFLYDDSVLTKLCEKYDRPEAAELLLKDKAEACRSVVAQGKPADDIKSASGIIYTKAKQKLAMTGVGNDMQVYDELRASIYLQ